MSDYQIALNLESQQLDEVSLAIADALAKITNKKEEGLKTTSFAPLELELQTSVLALSGFSTSIKGISVELAKLKVALTEITKKPEVKKEAKDDTKLDTSKTAKAKIAKDIEFDTSLLSLVVKGSKEIALLADQIAVSALDVKVDLPKEITIKGKVLLPKDIDVRLLTPKQVVAKTTSSEISTELKVNPIELKLQKKLQELVSGILTVRPLVLDLSAVIGDAVRDVITVDLGLETSIKTLANDLNLEISNAGEGFNIAESVELLTQKLISEINKAKENFKAPKTTVTTAKTEVKETINDLPKDIDVRLLTPKQVTVKGKVLLPKDIDVRLLTPKQVVVNTKPIQDALTVKPLELKLQTKLQALVSEALSVSDVKLEVPKEIKEALAVPFQDLVIEIKTGVDSLTTGLINQLQDSAPSFDSLVVSIKALAEKLNTSIDKSATEVDAITLPTDLKVKGKVLLPKDIDIKILTPKQIAVKGVLKEGDLSIKPIELKLQTRLQALVSEGLSVNNLTLSIPKILQEETDKTISELAVALKTSLSVFSLSLNTELTNAGVTFNVAESVEVLNQYLNSRILDSISDKPTDIKKVEPEITVELLDSLKVKGKVILPKDIEVKLLTPKQVAVKTKTIQDEITVKPLELKLQTKIQALVSEALSVGSVQIDLPKEIKEALAVPFQDLVSEIKTGVDSLTTGLIIQLQDSAPNFDSLSDAIKAIAEKLSKTINDSTEDIEDIDLPKDLKVKGKVILPKDIDIKLLTPKQVALKAVLKQEDLLVKPIELKLQTRIQALVSEGLSVNNITLSIPKILQESTASAISDLAASLKISLNTFSTELNTELSGTGFNVSESVTALNTYLNSKIAEATTQKTENTTNEVLDLSVDLPKDIIIKGKVILPKDIEIKLITPKQVAVKTNIKPEDLTLGLDAAVGLAADKLTEKINKSVEKFDISPAILELESELAKKIKLDEKLEDVDVTVKVPKAVAVKGIVQIPKSILVKLNVDKEITLDTVLAKQEKVEVELNKEEILKSLTFVPVTIELLDIVTGKITATEYNIDLAPILANKVTAEAFELKLKTAIQAQVKDKLTVEAFSLGKTFTDKINQLVVAAISVTGVEVDISSAVSQFNESLAKAQVSLISSAALLNTQLTTEGVDGTLIKAVVLGFISATAAKLETALQTNNIDEAAKVIKQTDIVSKTNTDVDLLVEATKLNTALSLEFKAAGDAIELSKVIAELNVKIKKEVSESDFDFKTSIDLLNAKLSSTVDLIDFKVTTDQISLVDIAISSLFTKISNAINKFDVPSATNDSKEKDLIERGNFTRTFPLLNSAREAGQISTEKINGSTKEGKERSLLATSKANIALRALKGLELEQVGRSTAEALANLIREVESVYDVVTPTAKRSIDEVTKLANEAATQSEILRNSLASERSSDFSPLSLDSGISAQIRIRKPNENTRIVPNNNEIKGGTPRDIRQANKLVGEETEELAFDLRVLSKQLENGNLNVGKALDSFAKDITDTANILGITVEELAAIDPGALRNKIQQFLTDNGVKFNATEGLRFGQNQVNQTAQEANSGIGGMIEVLSSFVSDFLQVQIGNKTDESKDFKQFEESGKDFTSYTDQANVEIDPAAKEAAQSAAEVIRNSATEGISESAQRVENAALEVFGVFGKISNFGLKAVNAQATLGKFGLGSTGNFLGKNLSGNAAEGLTKSSISASGAGITIDAITKSIKAAAPSIGLGVVAAVESEIKAISESLTEIVEDKKSEPSSAEPLPVEVQKPPEVKKNEEKVAKSDAESADNKKSDTTINNTTNITNNDIVNNDYIVNNDDSVNNVNTKNSVSNAADKTPKPIFNPKADVKPVKVNLGEGSFEDKLRNLRKILGELASIAKESGSTADFKTFTSTAAIELGKLIPKSNKPEDRDINRDQKLTIKAERARINTRTRELGEGLITQFSTNGARRQAVRNLESAERDIKNNNLPSAKKRLNLLEGQADRDAGANRLDSKIEQRIKNVRVKIEQTELDQSIDKLTQEIKEARLTNKADISKLTTAALGLKTQTVGGSTSQGVNASNTLLASIQRLDNSIKGITTKDFKEALSIASSQRKLGYFDAAENTLDNADKLSDSEKQSADVLVAQEAISTARIDAKYAQVVAEIEKVDLQGATEETINGLRKTAEALDAFPSAALKARNKIDALEKKLPKQKVEVIDEFKQNFDRSKNKSDIKDFKSSQEFLDSADKFAVTDTQKDSVTKQKAVIDSGLLKEQIDKITELISEIKANGRTTEKINKVKEGISNLPEGKDKNDLTTRLNTLTKEPVVKKNNEFGELISAVKKRAKRDIAPTSLEIEKLRSLSDTDSKKEDVNNLVFNATKPKKAVTTKNPFPEQLSLVNAQIKNRSNTSESLPALQGLIKTTKEAEQVLTVLKKIEGIKLDDIFTEFKNKANTLLNSGNNISLQQFAEISNQANTFKGGNKELDAGKILEQLDKAVDPFKKLTDKISKNLNKGVVPTNDELNSLKTLAVTDNKKQTVKEITEKTKEISLKNDFESFKESIAKFNNANDKSTKAITSVINLANKFKDTPFETKAQTAAVKFAKIPDNAFKDELKLQQAKKSANFPISTTKLESLVITEIEEAFVAKFKNSLSNDALESLFKDFTDSIQSVINKIKEGETDLENDISEITQNLELFQNTPRQLSSESAVISLQNVAEARVNKDFKDSKTVITRDLENKDKALEFITDLSKGVGVLANQAKGFLKLQESSKALKDFRDDILKVTQGLKRKDISPEEAKNALTKISSDFEASSVPSNPAISTQLFNANSAVIAKESGERNNRFTEAGQQVKLGRTQEAIKTYQELAEQSDSVGNLAQVALNKLAKVVVKLTLEEDNLLKLLNAEFTKIKKEARNSGDRSEFQSFASKVNKINPEGTELFKSKIAGLQADANFESLDKAEKQTTVKEKTERITSATDLLSTLQLVSGAFRNTIEVLGALAKAASVTTITLAKLEIANKGQIGQTAKDLTFAKTQQAGTGIAQQKTLEDLSSFKLAIPSQDKLDSNGNRVTQPVGSEEIERILKGLQSAGTANQLSGEEQAGASNAVLQILSKGQVQSEELKRQLANFLPGTVSNFAESQGITTAELESRLKRGEVGIDSLADFGDTLQKKFGKISEKDTPVKSVNTLTGNLQDIGFKTAVVPGAAQQGALSIINPLIAGFKESASLLSIAGLGFGGLVIKTIFSELQNSVDKQGTLFKTSRKVIGTLVQNPEENVKGQLNPFKKDGLQLSSLGSAFAKSAGAGLLTSSAVAISKSLGNESGGLDELANKASKNLSLAFDNLTKGIGSFLENIGIKNTEKNLTPEANKSKLLGDIFTQIIPSALLFSAAIGFATDKINGTKSAFELNKIEKKGIEINPPSQEKSTFQINPLAPPVPSKINQVSLETPSIKPPSKVQAIASGLSGLGSNIAAGALGLLANPLTAIIAPLVLALGTYAIANTKFTSEYSLETAKQIEELKKNTAELAKKNGVPAKIGQLESTDLGPFNLNKDQRDRNDERALFLGNYGAVTDFGLAQAVKKGKDTKDDRGSKEGLRVKSLADAEKELKRREQGGTVILNPYNDSTVLFDKALESATEFFKTVDENLEALSKKAVKSKEELAKIDVTKARLKTAETERRDLLDVIPKTPEEAKSQAVKLTDLESTIAKSKKELNESSTKGLKDTVTGSEDLIKSIAANRELFKDKAISENREADKTDKFKNSLFQFDQEENKAKEAKRIAKAELEAKDPSAILSRSNTIKENADLTAERTLNTQQQLLAKKEQGSTLKRLSEDNDRGKTVRDSEITGLSAKIDFTAIDAKLNAALALREEIGRNPVTEDGVEVIKKNEADIRNLSLEAEKKKGEIATANLQTRIAIEAKAAEELDRKRAKQQRKIDTLEAKGQLANTAEPNFQFNLNAVRQAEKNALLQERVAKAQVLDQSDLVKTTKIGKEAAQDKLEDLKVVSVQKSAARQSASRARKEAEEARLLEVADIASANRNRAITVQNSVASRQQLSFSSADNVINAKTSEKANSLNSFGARIDVEKQINVLAATRFGREQQFQKLEDLKAAKVQKDTDFYLSQLARVRAQYELLAELATNLANAKNNVNSAKLATATIANNQTFQNNTQTIKNDLAGTDTSARDDRQKRIEARKNLTDQTQSDKVAGSIALSALNSKLNALGKVQSVPKEAVTNLLNSTPAQIAQNIEKATSSKELLLKKKANGDESNVKIDDNALSFSTNSATAIDEYIQFLNTFVAITTKKEQDIAGIKTLDLAASNASTARQNTSQRDTETLNINTSANKTTEADINKSLIDKENNRNEIFKPGKVDSAKDSALKALIDFRLALSTKERNDTALKTDSATKVRTLTANQSQAIQNGQTQEANQLGTQIFAEKENLKSKLDITDVSAIENFVDSTLQGLKSLLGDELKLLSLREDVISRERSLLELRKSLGLFKETTKEASTRSINNQIDDANLSIVKSRNQLKNEQTPEGIINALSLAEKETREDPKSNKIAKQGLRLALDLQAQGGFTAESINKLKRSLDGLSITALERATAISLANAKIDREKNINNNKSLADLADSEDALKEQNSTGRFSGINNTTISNRNKQNKANRNFRDQIDIINNDELNDTDNLTLEEKAIKFGTRRKIAENTRSQELSTIKSDSRQIAEDIAGTITSNLKFDQFFKDIVSGTSVGDAAAKIGESIFDGLANYFSQKAQKSLNDIIGGFFENLFDGLFGTIKDKAKESVKTNTTDLVKPLVASVSPAGLESLTKSYSLPPALALPTALSVDSPLNIPPSMRTNYADSLETDEDFRSRLTPEAKTVLNPEVKRRDVSIFSPYHPDNNFNNSNNSDISLTEGVSQAEGDLSKVPELADNRPDLPIDQSELIRNSVAIEANTLALGQNSQSSPITDGLTGVNLAEDEAFNSNLPTTIPGLESVGTSLSGFALNLDATKDPISSFGNSLLSVLSGIGGGSNGGGGLLSSLIGGIGGLFGGGSTEGIGLDVLNEVGSFADGDIRSALNMPKTPTKDPRERGADSRLAVVNSQELIVPASLARQFLKYSDNLSRNQINEATSNNQNNSTNTNNNQSYSTVNNIISENSFGRSSSANAVINDAQGENRKRFKTS